MPIFKAKDKVLLFSVRQLIDMDCRWRTAVGLVCQRVGRGDLREIVPITSF